MRIVIPGRPRTKKNSQRIIYNLRRKAWQIIQSKSYKEYQEKCLKHLLVYKNTKLRFKGPVQICAHYWLPNRRSWPDLLGLLQATCDILEKAGVIKNDRYVMSLDGSRIVGLDPDNPRVEVEIKKLEWRENE